MSSYLQWGAAPDCLETLVKKVTNKDTIQEALSALASYLVWGSLAAEKAESAPGAQMHQALHNANPFQMQAVAQQQIALMQQQMNKQMGPDAAKNTPTGRMETAFSHVTEMLVKLIDKNDNSVPNALAAYLFCVELAISGLPQKMFTRAVAPHMVGVFQHVSSCASSGHAGVLAWLKSAPEHLIRFVKESAICRDPAEWGKAKPRLGALNADLEMKDGYAPITQPEQNPIYLALQEVVGWFDLEETSWARARFEQFFAYDLVVLCEQTKKAQKNAVDDDPDKQVRQNVANTQAASLDIMNQAFGNAGQRRAGPVDTSAMKASAANIGNSAMQLANSRLAFMSIQPFYKLYDGPLLVPAIPAIMSLIEHLDSAASVVKKAQAQSTVYMNGQAMPAGGSAGADQGSFVVAVAATLVPRAFRALARSRQVADFIPYIVKTAGTISYRSNFYHFMAEELMKTGQVFSPYLQSLAIALFGLFQPVTAPYRGSLQHPKSNERVLAKFGIDNMSVAAMQPMHVASVSALLRILASIAVLQPLALIPYRSMWASLIFSSQMQWHVLDHVCIIAGAIGRLSAVQATYFVRVGCFALKYGTPMTQSDMRSKGFIMSMLKTIATAHPSVFTQTVAELSNKELDLPSFPELKDVDVSIGGEIMNRNTPGAQFTPLSFLETLVNDSLDTVASPARYICDVVAGKEVHFALTELAIRDARIEERLKIMDDKIERNAAMTQQDIADIKSDIAELANQVDANTMELDVAKSDISALQKVVSDVQLDIFTIREEANEQQEQNAANGNISADQMMQQVMDAMRVQLAELKNQFGEFAKRIPVPRKVVVREGGIFRATVELHFVCESHQMISKSMDAAASAACLCSSERNAFVVESKHWRKWMTVCVSAVGAASSAAMGNIGGALSSLAAIYNKLKQPGESEFHEFVSKLQSNPENQDLMTSNEQNDLVTALRNSGFYDMFVWEPQTMQWCCHRCKEKAKSAVDKWRKMEEDRKAREKALVTKKELQAEKAGIETTKSSVVRERDGIAKALEKCTGMFEKQGHQVKNWKKRFVHLDTEKFLYATAQGQEPIKCVKTADIKRYARFDDHAKSIGLQPRGKPAEECFYVVTNDDWHLLVHAGNAQALNDWIAGFECLDKVKVLDEQINGYTNEIAAVDARIAALKV